MKIPVEKAHRLYSEEGAVSALVKGARYFLFVVKSRYLRMLEDVQWNVSYQLAVGLFLSTHWIIPGLGIIILRPNNGLYLAKNLLSGEKFYFPRLPGVVELGRLGSGYSSGTYNKYTLDGFAEPDSNDVIVDVGAFVGAFSVATADIGSIVIACEPSSETVGALMKNVECLNITIEQRVISDNDGTVELNLGSDMTDHSILDVDGRSTGETETVESIRLDSLAEERGLNTIDFLKIDAEGAEKEVIEGASGVSIRKVAVDCSPERFGNPTYHDVEESLRDRGMTVERRGFMVYAKQQ